MSRLAATLQRAAEWLQPHRDALLSDWARAVADVTREPCREAHRNRE